MINKNKKQYKRTKHEKSESKIHYIEPERLKLFTRPFSFKKCLKLTSEAHGGFRTASFLVSWVPRGGYTVEGASVANCYNSQSFANRDYWVSSKQLYDLQNSAKNVVLMLWEVFRRPASESVNVKISHIPTYRLIKDWRECKPQQLPKFKMQNHVREVTKSFLVS